MAEAVGGAGKVWSTCLVTVIGPGMNGKTSSTHAERLATRVASASLWLIPVASASLWETCETAIYTLDAKRLPGPNLKILAGPECD